MLVSVRPDRQKGRFIRRRSRPKVGLTRTAVIQRHQSEVVGQQRTAEGPQAKWAVAGSAPRPGRGGRRFKSCHSDHFPEPPIAYAASYAERNSTSDPALPLSVGPTRKNCASSQGSSSNPSRQQGASRTSRASCGPASGNVSTCSRSGTGATNGVWNSLAWSPG